MLRRISWALVGLLCVALGAIGIIVPGLPTTVFFIGAAASFARSSPRLEAWVLSLPKIGPAVAAYRSGQGMPLAAKRTAVVMIVLMVSLSVVFIAAWWAKTLVATAGVVGVAAVLRVPTAHRRVEPPVGGC